jgi:hypothetical protein
VIDPCLVEAFFLLETSTSLPLVARPLAVFLLLAACAYHLVVVADFPAASLVHLAA